MANETFANTLVVEVAGAPLPADVRGLLTYAYVDDSRNLPDTFVLRFRDPGAVVLGKAGFKIGALIELKVQTSDPGGPQSMFSGEVTALGIDLDATGTFTEVRGYDLAHRLFRGRRVALYPEMSIADVVRKVVSRAGLTVGTVDDVAGVGGQPHTQISQNNISDWEFLARLADTVGAQVAIVDKKLNFRLPAKPDDAPDSSAKATTNPLVLEAHRTLMSLRAGVTAAEQVPEVRVGGWDFQNKQPVSGHATPNTAGAEAGGVDPTRLAGIFSAPPFLVADTPRHSDAEAAAVATALAAQLGSAAMELTGVARGNPKLRAGTDVALTNVGDPFAGKYTLTATRHLFTDHAGYTTEFTVSGRQERSLYGLATGRTGAMAGTGRMGLVPGVVSDVKDPDQLGRVKLTFPWLDNDFSSNWARIAQSGAGLNRGAVVLPEVGDEVLVGFEHGDFDAPYVLGGLFNGKDTLPRLSADPVDGNSGEIAVRAFVSRKGHRVEFIETDGILIRSGDQKLIVKLDAKNEMIELTSSKGVHVKADNGVTIESGQGPLALKGQKITLNSDTDVEVTANAALKMTANSQAQLQGATVSVAGQAQAELTASGPLTVRGAIVRIN
ncbi:MAG TPA: VgrG-related protein [Pseudonocardiaceae bacterium]|nr:VgrG-related protein [Pseudonocardiaceae bacterium]